MCRYQFFAAIHIRWRFYCFWPLFAIHHLWSLECLVNPIWVLWKCVHSPVAWCLLFVCHVWCDCHQFPKISLIYLHCVAFCSYDPLCHFQMRASRHRMWSVLVPVHVVHRAHHNRKCFLWPSPCLTFELFLRLLQNQTLDILYSKFYSKLLKFNKRNYMGFHIHGFRLVVSAKSTTEKTINTEC